MRQSDNIKIRARRVTSIILAAFVLFGMLLFCGDDFTQNAYAAGGTSGLQQGDILTLRDGDWEDSYIVLEPDKMSNKQPGAFLLKKHIEENVAFNYDLSGDDYLEVANKWEGSLAQTWCMFYYRRLPQAVKDAVVGVKSNETESGTDWAGVNNIDGTRTGDSDYDKDKAFFLSFIEYDSHKDISGMANGQKWHLRAPYTCGDLAVYVCVVDENGRVMNYGYTDKLGARPALNMDLTAFDTASKCRHGSQATWVIDAEEQAGCSDVRYEWSGDHSQCTATAKCNNCGVEICETAGSTSDVTREATTESEGEVTYTVEFEDKSFETQTVTEATEKKAVEGAEVSAGEIPSEVLDNTLPGVTLKKLSGSKKSLTVKWKKLSKKKQKKIKGIEIQYSDDRSLAGNTAVRSAKKSKASAKISRLGHKKTYWVRARTYKYVGGVKHVSAWSKVKKGKTK